MKIYCHGRILAENEATISAGDHGFLYGATLFETFRTFGGDPFLLEDHLDRLIAGCRSFGIVPPEGLLISDPPPYRSLRKTIRALLDENKLTDAVFRYTLSAGEAPAGLPEGPYKAAAEILYVRPLPAAGTGEKNRLHILDTRRTEPEVFPRPKSGHFMNSIAAHRELRRRSAAPGDEGIMLTGDERLSEGMACNLFLVAGGRISTPSPAAHILAGITRKKVLALAEALGLTTAETDLGLRDLIGADAIFTTNSVRGIVPVGEVIDGAGNPVWEKNSADDETVRQLLAAYAALHV